MVLCKTFAKYKTDVSSYSLTSADNSTNQFNTSESRDLTQVQEARDLTQGFPDCIIKMFMIT